MNKILKHRTLNQRGIVSIIVTLIIMLVISLVVISFAKLSRQEARQTLDQQLNTQAFYAAESGVDDAATAFGADPTLLATDYNSNCGAFITAAGLKSGLDNPSAAAATIKYSCLLVDPTPGTLEFSNIGDTFRAVPVQSKSGTPLNSITIGWQDTGGATDFAACPSTGTFTDAAGWSCKTGVLRIDLVPTTSVKRSDLNANVKAAFLVPGTGGGSTWDFTKPTGQVVAVACSSTNSPKYCSATISNLTASSYFIRIKSLYRNSTATLAATDAGGRVELSGAQVLVDSTGKANDVLRRIQVRIPLTGVSDIPEGAIESGTTICKRLQVDSATTAVVDPGDASDAACTP
jgi:hypothetical protein